MKTDPTKEPAFPRNHASDGHNGMTIRDYFAAKALAGMASQYHEHWTEELVAKCAYELADAMLKERVK